jgi:hypothetical protein
MAADPYADWSDTPAPAQDKYADWADSPAGPTVSQGEAAVMGVGSGGALGWDDEIGAAMQAGLAALTPGMDAAETYKQARSENRQLKDAAEAQQGTAYTTGQVAGGVASGLATGGAGAGLKGAMATNAALGAVNAAGNADELDAQGGRRPGWRGWLRRRQGGRRRGERARAQGGSGCF